VDVGTRVVLAIRPERIVLGAAPGADNRFDAVVSGVVYLGDHARVELTLPSGRTLSAKLPNDAGRTVPAVGEAIAIGWRAEDCLAFDPGELAAKAEEI
jgi:putative spermidine/putrescine transport system ATP-binding protein